MNPHGSRRSSRAARSSAPGKFAFLVSATTSRQTTQLTQPTDQTSRPTDHTSEPEKYSDNSKKPTRTTPGLSLTNTRAPPTERQTSRGPRMLQRPPPERRPAMTLTSLKPLLLKDNRRDRKGSHPAGMEMRPRPHSGPESFLTTIGMTDEFR